MMYSAYTLNMQEIQLSSKSKEGIWLVIWLVTTLMAESKEELKSLLMKVKEESEKDGLKLNVKNDRVISAGFQGKTFNTTVIQVYAPTTSAE